jgi:hypothetical protein
MATRRPRDPARVGCGPRPRPAPTLGRVIVYRPLTALPHVQAQLLAGALEAEGVAVRLERPDLASVYALDLGPFATRVLVDETQLELARTLLDRLEAPES